MARLPRMIRSRAARVLPPRLRQLARSLDRARRGAPQIGLPVFSRVLVVTAHPDDETVMCGGTIALLATTGATVTVVVATDGDATSAAGSRDAVGAARRAEVTAACALLGAQPPRLLGHRDGALAASAAEFTVQLAAAVSELSPDLVIAPWWLDDHPDHRAVCHALAAVRLPPGVTIWLGEIWTPLHPNRVVDIGEVVELKRQALEVHRTANQAIAMEAFLGLSRYRSLSGLGGSGHAEAFVAIDPAGLGEALEDE